MTRFRSGNDTFTLKMVPACSSETYHTTRCQAAEYHLVAATRRQSVAELWRMRNAASGASDRRPVRSGKLIAGQQWKSSAVADARDKERL